MKFQNPSGFPEHLPEILKEEIRLKNTIKEVYESYGYIPLETSSVEYLKTLSSKGEISKEVYTLKRALAEEGGTEDDRGLHFDLTIPFARYVVQNYGNLSFPFKRYQIQKVWRGDRPQAGRFREFYQADIDIVSNDILPLHYDAEVLEVIYKIFEKIKIGNFIISLNNRKFLNGLLSHLGFLDNNNKNYNEILKIIDKYDKIGEEQTKLNLIELGFDINKVNELFKILSKNIKLDEVDIFFEQLNIEDPIFKEGIKEIQTVSSYLKDLDNTHGQIIFNSRIARGLDYYTGTVYETHLVGLEKYGSICSGGRYADLAGKFSNKDLPGVGVSIGLSRLMYILQHENKLKIKKLESVNVLIGLIDETQRNIANKIARVLRNKNIKTMVFHDGHKKLGKQVKYADKIGSQYFLIINEGKEDSFVLKNLPTSQEQIINSIKDLIQHITL